MAGVRRRHKRLAPKTGVLRVCCLEVWALNSVMQVVEGLLISIAQRLYEHLPFAMAAGKLVEVTILVSQQTVQHLLSCTVINCFLSGQRQRAESFVMGGDPFYG